MSGTDLGERKTAFGRFRNEGKAGKRTLKIVSFKLWSPKRIEAWLFTLWDSNHRPLIWKRGQLSDARGTKLWPNIITHKLVE